MNTFKKHILLYLLQNKLFIYYYPISIDVYFSQHWISTRQPDLFSTFSLALRSSVRSRFLGRVRRQAKIRCNEEKRQKEGREEAIIIRSANRAKERLHGRVLTDALISTPKRSVPTFWPARNLNDARQFFKIRWSVVSHAMPLATCGCISNQDRYRESSLRLYIWIIFYDRWLASLIRTIDALLHLRGS